MSVFTLTGGTDNFTGNASETNTVFLTPITLQPVDAITGGATGSFFDILTIIEGGTIAAGQFAGVTRFELLNLANAGNIVALTNGLVAESSAGIFSVVGGGGNDTVDASGVTNGMRIAFYAVSGVDSFIGGNGNDYVEFAVAELTAADTVNGGNGFDILAFSTGGTVSAAALGSVSHIEELILSNAGNSVTLSNAFVASADNSVMSILGGTGNDTIDASGVTNGIRVAFYASSGSDTFTGGNGSDYLAFVADQLTSADHITAGANNDIIEFTSAGTVSAAAFTNVTGIDTLILNNGGNAVTLSNGLAAGADNGVFVVLGGTGSDTVNASAVTANRVVFEASSGDDSFTGGGGSDVAIFAADLSAADAFAGGAGFDILQLTTAGTIGAAAFTNFTGLDELFLTLGGNTITLNGGVVASSDGGVFVVFDQGGDNIVDASAATLGGRVVFNAMADGNKTYTGGTGSDFFQFAAANLNGDTLAGGNGAGTDFLVVTDNGAVTAANLANVTQMEIVQLAAGGSIALANTLSNNGSLEVDGTAALDSIDGSAVSGYNIVIKGGGGADTLKGGGGNDQIFLPDTSFVAIDGNDGFDKIVLTAAFDGQTFDLTTQVSKITDTEAIVLDSAAGASVELTAADIAQINASGNLLYIAGGSDDEVTVNGTGWAQLETNHTNPNLPGHTFVHYHNTNGSDLYIDILTPTNINLGGLAAQPDAGTAAEDVIVAPFGNLIDNDIYTGSGSLSISAVAGATDGGTTLTIDGTYGRLVVTKATGNYTYTLGVTAAQQNAVQQLGDDADNIAETPFSYTVTDGSLTSSANLNIKVYGTNDGPVATATVVPNAPEDAAYSFDVSTLFTDIDSVPSADTLTYSVAGLPAGLTLAGSTISGTPTNADVGSHSISVTATDGHGGSLTRAFSLSVANTNDAPAGTAASFTVNEDTPLAGSVSGTDVDGDGLTYSLVAGSAVNGSAAVNPDGTFTFTPAANFSGDATFQFRANDGTVDSASQTVTIHVTAVNDAPTAAGAGNTASGNEDNTISGSVPAGSDVDDATPALTYELVNGPNTATEGTLTFNSDGTFSFAPVSNFNGAAAFTYRVLDPHGAHSDPQNFTISVLAQNDDPVAAADVAPQATIAGTSLVVDAAHGVLANDTDADGGTLSVSAMTGAIDNGTTFTVVGDHGTVVVNKATGAYTYTALPATPPDYGTDSFNYAISDGQGGTSTSTLAIEVTEQGYRTLDASSLDGSGNIFVGTGNTGASYNVSENHAAGLELGLKVHYRTGDDLQPLSRDADGTAHYLVPLGLQAIDPAHHVPAGSANRVAWSFDYSVNTDASGSSGKTLAHYNFTITISDGEGHTQIYDLQHLSATNTPWQLQGGPANTGFGDEEIGAALTSPTLSQNSVNIGFAFLQAAFGDNLAGKHFDIQLTATDAATGALAASVHDQLVVDTPPVATPNTASVTEDFDNDGITAGTQTLASGNVITDATADSDINGNPIAVSAVNGGAGNVGASVAGTYGTLVVNANGSYTYTLNNALPSVQSLGATATATDIFTYTITDGVTPNASATATLTVTVHGSNDPVNSPPTLTAEVTEDLITVTSGNVLDSVTDADSGDTHAVTAVNGLVGNVGTGVAGTYGSLTINAAGNAQYILNNSLLAVQQLNTGSPALTDSFTYTVSDGHGSFATTTLNVSVHGTNDTPVANFDFATVAEDTAGPAGFNVLTNDSDADAADTKTVTTFTFAGVTNNAGTAVTLGNGLSVNVATNGDVSFTQSGVFNGLNNGQSSNQLINYTMVDSAGAQSSATAQILVTGVNDAPVANANTITVIEDTPTAINVLGNDTDADGPGPLTLDSITGTSGTTTIVAGNSYTIAVSGGSLSVSTTGALTFTPAADVSGPGAGSFSYVAKDGNGALSGSAAVTINVTPVNDAPTAAVAGNTAAGNEDNTIVGSVPAGSDIDDATLTYQLVSGPNTATEGTLTFNTDGTFSFAPIGNFNGAVAFTYRVVDPHGAHSDPQNFTITVNPVNDLPVGTAASFTINEDTPLAGSVSGTDVDGNSLTYALVAGSAVNGSAAVNPDGTFTFAPAANFSGDATFQFRANDGTVNSAAQTVTIHVTAVNDAPQTNFDPFTVAENALANLGSLLANDTDIDGPNLQVTSFTVIVGGTGTFSAGSTATLASGATLSVAANGDVTLTQGASYDHLGNGDTAQVLFSYQVTDNGSPAMTAGDAAQILINGVNEAPTLSLGSPLAALEIASSSPLGVAVAAATAAVTDEESKLKTIEVDISSGYQDGTGSAGERAQLSALGDFALSLFGGSASFVDHGNHGTLTVSFPTPITASQATLVLKQIDYIDQIGDFTLAIAQDDTRTISVRVQDHNDVWSNTVTHDVNIAADVVDGTGNGTFVGGRFNDTIDGAMGDDTLTGGKGDDSLIGGDNSATGDTVNYAKELDGAQVSEIGTQGVIVNLSSTDYDLDGLDPVYNSIPNNDDTILAGRAVDTYDSHDTLSGIENITGTAHDDIIVDAAAISNSYSGGEGTVPAPEVAGDTVVFRGTLGPDAGNPGAPYFRVLATGVEGDDFTVQYFDPDLGVGGTVLATDTLTDIESMVFDNGAAASILNAENPVWVIEDGFLIGTHTSVAAAVAQANLLGGTTVVEIGHGTTPPADYDEGTINVTRAMTIKGIGAQQIIHATGGVDLFVVSGSAAGLVRLDNLALSDDGFGATADYGIRFAGTYGVNASTNLQVSGVSISGFEQNGLLMIGGGTTMNVAVDQSSFSGNGGAANSGGSGDILFFEYTGAASLEDVTVTGTTSGLPAATADYGIQFAGFRDSDDAIANAIGNVSFDTVTVTGHYDNALVYVQGYNNLSGLSFTATTIGDAASTAGWTGLYAEPKSTGGPFTPSGTTSTLDLTNVTLAGTYGWQTTFQLPGADLILGVPTNDHIIGSGSNDAIRTLTGDDAIEAGGGNDLIVYDTLPGARHTVDGGLDTDTQVVFGTAGAETFNVNAVSPIQLGINILAGTSPASTVAATGANYEVATTAVEQINIQTGNGGDSVVITGDLQGTGVATSTITVVGGTGNDMVDASGMLNAVDTGPGDASRVGIDFTGAAGNDTFISNSIGTADRFDGGTNTTGDTADYSYITGGGVSVHLGNQSATDIGGTGVGSDTLIGVENAIGSAQNDVLVGSSVANTLDGGSGDDSLAGNAGNDSLVGDLGTDTADYSLESGTNGVTVDLGLGSATDTFANTDTLTSIENATGTSLTDTLTGGTGANVLTGLGGNDTLTGTGNDTLIGGAHDDIYYAHMSDDVQENSGQGTDEVRATHSYTLDANVENLTLLDLGDARTEAFGNFDLGPIADGENDWQYAGTSDQTIVDLGGSHGKVLRMSSDPTTGAFGGPYSPALTDAAGEPQTTADFSGQSIRFDFKAVDPAGDNSRLEVDFGRADGTDRNNFMVIEATAAGGIRIAVNEPTTTVNNWAVNDFTAFTGNRTLTSLVDPAEWHQIELRLNYVDGASNDLIDVYLDGHHIGTTTTFENFRDWTVGPTHADNAEANQTSRVFFRNSASGATNDGPGGQNEGFYFDNLNYGVHNNLDGTGNDLANIITGNSGDNTLTGAGANDQLIGGAGIDTAKYDDAYANYAVTYTSNAHGFVTGASQVQETGPAGLVAEATDTLTGIERLEFSGLTLDLTQRVQLFDGANKLIGTFDHIQDAVDVAADGYAIRLSAGTFAESVTIDRNVAILGANSGDPAAGSRVAESVIAGQVSVTAAHSATNKVTIDGVEIFNTSSNSVSFTGIQVSSGADVSIKNSIFFSPIPNANNAPGTADRAIMLTTGASGTIAIDHNLFTGGPTAHNMFSTAAWTTAIWSDGAQTQATIDSNTFEWVRTAINADDFDGSFNVVNNTFQNSGSGISIGGAAGGANADVASITSIHDNTFSNVGTDFNLQNITAAGKQIGLDLTATNNHAVNTAADAVTVLAGGNADTITGSIGVDALVGNGGNDSLDGGAGNDGLAGSGADDTLHGGAGDDALFGGALLGADAGKDTATYDNARANYTLVATSADGFVITVTDVTEGSVVGTDEGHDTLSGVEVLQFGDVTLDLTQNVQLFDSAGKLIGTFGTIQGAVNAAAGNAGTSETIRIREGVYTEQVTIDGTAGTLAGLTNTGANTDGNPVTGVTVKAPVVLGINGVSDHWGDSIRAGIAVKNVTGVTISNLAVDGSYAGDTTPGSNGDEVTGIAYLHASGAINNVHVEHTSNSAGGGLFGLQHGSGIFADNGTGPQLSLAITGSTIDTFQKTGILIWNANVDVRDNTVTGIGATSLTAQNAMQIGGSSGTIGAAGDGNTFGGVGYTGGFWSSTGLIVYEPTAALTIANNTFNGTGNASALTVGLDLTDVASGITVTVSDNAFGTVGHGLYDGIDAYTFLGTLGLGSDPVMSGNTFTEITGNGIYLDPEFVATGPAFTTSAAFTETGSDFADVLHGSNGADNFSGGAGNDDLAGRLGVDTLHGDAGDDTIAWRAGDGNDSIDGDADSDTLEVAANGHSLTLTATGSSFTVSQDDSPATNTATVTEVEEVNIALSGGETITLVGDFTAAGVDVNSIVVNGSTGTTAETVDASGMTSIQHIDFTGGSGNDTFVESNAGGNDTFNGNGGVDTVDFSHETTGGITVDLSNAGAQNTVNAGMDTFSSVENAIGTAQADTITGSSADNVLTGGDASDTLKGAGGNDTIHGGDGTADKAVYDDAATNYTVTYNVMTGEATVAETGAPGAVHEGTDTLDGVELLDFLTGDIDLSANVLVFLGDYSGSGFGTLKGSYATIQAAIDAGTTVDGDTLVLRAVTFTQEVDVTKDLTILGANHGLAGDDTLRGDESTLVGGFHITSSGVTIDGVEILEGREDYGQQRAGVFIEGARADITVKNSIIDQTTTPHPDEDFQHGIVTTYGADTSNLQVRDNVIKNWGEGVYLNPGAHDSTFDGNVFDDNGNHILIEDLDDLTITNNDFGTSAGSKIYAVAGGNPTDAQIELGLSGNTFEADGKPPLSIQPSGPDGQVILGTSINDRFRGDLAPNPTQTFEGRAGDDSLIGGTGTDTARYGVDVTGGDITAVADADPFIGGNQAGWQVVAGAEGTDMLVGMEIIDDANGGNFLLVGNGGFATIQEAIDAAAASGDTIILASGPYTEDLTISKAITIVGANHGVDGTAPRGPESIITGTVTVTLTSGAVNIDGVQIDNTSSNATQFKGIVVTSGADVTIENSRFMSTGPNGNNGDRAIELQSGATGTILIDDNFFGGTQDGPSNRTGNANWTSGVWSDGSSASLTITGNEFNSVRTGLNLDGYDDGVTNVSLNKFVDSGTGISIGTPSANVITGIHDNTFNGVNEDFNLQNITTSQSFNLDTTNNVSTSPLDAMVVLGGTASDTITGSDGVDILLGTGLNTLGVFPATGNTLKGGEGDDILYGDFSDTLPVPNPTAPSEADVAAYDVTITLPMISMVADADPITGGSQAGWQVATGGAEGTDLLNNIEIVAGAGRYLLVGNGGLTSIQDAVNAASDGDTILIATGTWAGAGNAGVAVDKAVSFIGMGAVGDTIIDASTFSYGFNIDLAADKALGTVMFKNLTIDNALSSGIQSRDHQVLGTLTLDNVRIEDSGFNGLYASGRKASPFYDQAGVQNVNVLNSTFANNGQSNSNSANVMLFEFDGNATLTNVTASNTIVGGNSAAYGIQVAGFDSDFYDQIGAGAPGVGSFDVLTAMGTVTFDNVDITGNYRKPGLYVQGFTDTTGLSFTDTVVDVDSTSFDKPVIIDPMADQLPTGMAGTAANAGSFFNETSAIGSYDLSGITVTQLAVQFSELDGTTKAETIVGTNANDQITGFDGADNLNGGAGNDAFIIATPAEHAVGETIDGGGDADTIRFTSTTAGATLILNSGVTNIEEIEISNAAGLNTGTTALNINAAAAGGTYTLTGNAGNNVLTAGGGSNIVDAGAGDDTIVGIADGASDTVNGEGNTPVVAATGIGGDTVDYSGTTGVNVSLSAGAATVTTGGVGTDTLSGIENITGGTGIDNLDGDANANILAGNGGADVLQGFVGSDRLDGGADNDQLFGGNDADWLIGGSGADTLNGGGDADTFVYNFRSEAGTFAGGGEDQMNAFSTAQSDKIAFDDGFFSGAGITLAGDFNAGGFVKGDYFVIGDVDVGGTYVGGTPGNDATFVLDNTGVVGGIAVLYFDADGNGNVTGANDVKIAIFDVTSTVALQNTDLLLI